MSIYLPKSFMAGHCKVIRMQISEVGSFEVNRPFYGHAIQLWREERRGDLVNYLRENELLDHVPYWKLAQALFEVMPRDEEDWKLISSLLGERETLRLEAKQQSMFDS